MSAHFVSRTLRRLGFEPRIIPAKYTKPFLKGQKNDYNDAEAIAEAALRPNLKVVSEKTQDQLDLQALHRVRSRLVSRRTATINQIRAFLIEQGTPGLEIGRKTHKMGMRTSETYDLVLKDCRIPKSALIGELNQGFAIAMKTLEAGRVGIAAQAVGIAQAALDLAKKFSNEREAFGKPINRYQGIQWKIADMTTRIHAARMLTYRAAWMKDQGLPMNKEGAMAKLFASRIAREASNESLQIHGGYGYTDEFRIERLYRDAKVTEIYEGTSEIQKIVISRALLGRAKDARQPAIAR